MQSIKLDVQVEWKFINDKFLSKKVGKMPEIEPKDKSLKKFLKTLPPALINMLDIL